MTILLPIASIAVLVALFLRRGCRRSEAVVMACCVGGVLLLAITELLSLLTLLNANGVRVAWLLTLVVSVGCLRAAPSVPRWRCTGRWRSPSIAATAALALGIGVLAVLAAPNTWDSMSYHLGRAVHWQANASVAHYPTSISRQLFNPPLAEFALLHTLLLSGSDRLVNLVQWAAMLGCLAAVFCASRQLGGGVAARRLAVVYVATLPMGILQASSTQNDYVVALWLSCLVVMLSRAAARRGRGNVVLAGIAAGLALATKGTAYLYVAPFGVQFALQVARRCGWRESLLRSSVVAGVAVALAAPHLLRNWRWSGDPMGGAAAAFRVQGISAGTLLSNVLRNLSLHTGTPFDGANRVIEAAVTTVHAALDLDVDDPATTEGPHFAVRRTEAHEDRAGNPLHFLLALVAIATAGRRVRRRRQWCGHVAATLAAFLLFCLWLRWQPWHSRLHLPLFVVAAPAVAVVATAPGSVRVARIWLVVALLAAPYYLLKNASRPVLSTSRSVLTVPRERQYFATNREQARDFSLAVAEIVRASPPTLGLVVDEGFFEYPLWVLLAAGSSQTHIVHVVEPPAVPGQTSARRLPAMILGSAVAAARIDRLRRSGLFSTARTFGSLTLLSR